MRLAGIVLLLVGLAIPAGYGAYAYVRFFLLEPNVPLWLRGSSAIIALGFILLLLSLIRERLENHRREPFKEVER